VVLLQKLPSFKYRTDGTFRGWLHEVTRNKWLELQRGKWRTTFIQGEDLDAVAARPDGNLFEEREFQAFLIQRLLDLTKADVAETTAKAFEEHVIKGRPAWEVAQELGISLDVVYSAKSRFLRRLRAELPGEMD
jgi:DNA-directed RNA polymerase specialized sigma24 family protein